MANESSNADLAVLTHRPSLPLEGRTPALSDLGQGHGTVIDAQTTMSIMATTTGSTLNMAQFHKVWDHNFATNHSFDPELTRHWGDISLTRTDATLISRSSSSWQHDGMMQAPTSATAGNGYGLYSITLQIDKGEGPGAYACLWPATDGWPGPELDLVEKASTANNSGYSTIHWATKDPLTLKDVDNYEVHMFPTTIDVSRSHTYALDWEADHISLYIDKVLIYTTTQHVPADAAHGGQNEAFGAGMQPWGTQNSDGSNIMHVTDMSYYSPIA